MKSLFRILLAVLDARLWKAVLVLTALIASAVLLHKALGPDADDLIVIAVLAPLTYFALRYARQILFFFRGSTRGERMITLLEILGVFHVLALASFFTVPFGAESLQNLYRELFEVHFWIFPVLIACVWALASLLIVLHYRGEGPGGVRGLRVLAVGVCVILLGIAVGAMALVPPAIPLFRDFGADLPGPTLILFSSYEYWLLLPVMGVVVSATMFALDEGQKVARFATGSLAGLLVLANVGVLWTLLGITLPFARCGGMPDLGAGFTRLHAAVMLGKFDSVAHQLGAGAHVNAEDQEGRTPLLIAVGNASLPMAKLLDEHGARVNFVTAHGTSPLHTAAAAGQSEIIEWLLAKGALPNAVDRTGGTPLHRAAYRDQGEAAAMLIAAGADVNAENHYGDTPLDLAVQGKSMRVVALLEGRGGVRSTKESRQRKVDAYKPLARTNTPVGSCGV